MNTQDIPFVVSPYKATPRRAQAVGRPLFRGKDEGVVVAKLQYAFSIGATSKEACGFADISTDALYRYCAKHPEFRDRIELLQTAPILMARKIIFDAIAGGNVKIARWYLERKRPEEFSVSKSLKEESEIALKLQALRQQEEDSDVSMKRVVQDTVLLSELLEDAYLYYILANPTEKQQIITKVFSELTLYGNTLDYKCKDGFRVLENRKTLLCDVIAHLARTQLIAE